MDSFEDKYRKLTPSSPSHTLVAHLEKDANMFIHPEQPRGITVREAARLQTFKDDFIFTGSFGKQFKQVGNAVPPEFMKLIGDLIVKIKNGRSSICNRKQRMNEKKRDGGFRKQLEI